MAMTHMDSATMAMTRMDSTSMKAIHSGKVTEAFSAEPWTPFGVLRGLEDTYGWRLLALLFVAQWVVKGLAWGFILTASEFLLRDYAVPGPKMQVYKAIILLPWAMKPLFGLLSDNVPILGYRRGPYIVIITILAAVAHSTIGLIALRGLSVRGAVLCLVFGAMQVSVVDLLTEARYAEKMREHPERGPDLMTYVLGGLTVGNLLATSSVGFIIELWGSTAVYLIASVLAAQMLLPVAAGWLEEPSGHAHQPDGRPPLKKELLVLTLAVGGASITMLLVGLLQDSIWVNLSVAVVASALVVGLFLLLVNPIISLMNCFFFVQTCAAVDISGASFYFFTDGPVEYPHGPHFSKVFFASGLGVCTALLNLVGMYIYNRYMQHWRYQSLFIFANLLLCAINIISVLVYTRSNLALGLPDEAFVLGAWGAAGVASVWMWMPGVVLLSHLCPAGLEATMYALLAGCHNMGASVASFIGACLLQVLGVAPSGMDGEQRQFDNLWIAALISAILPTVVIVLLPWMIPNASQTESLFRADTCPTTGSPWHRWTKEGVAMTEGQTCGSEPLTGNMASGGLGYGATTA